MKKYIFVILVQLFLISTLITAKEPEIFSGRFHQSLDIWINGQTDTESFFEEINNLDEILEQEVSGWENLYWQARLSLLRGQIYYEWDDKKQSIRELKTCRELAEEAISIQENSDSWRIMSEASSLIMLQKGMGYIILNFSKSRDQAEQAIELDPQNARASLVFAQFLSNAPSIAGGNIDEGIEMLQNLSYRSDLINEDRFFILLTLSKVLQKDKQIDAAINACREALIIFPGNLKGQNLLRSLQSQRL